MFDRACKLLAAALVAACATLAHAASPVFLEQLTSAELQSQVRAGTTTVLVPIGGTEQNGPHMVLGKHNVRVKALCERIATALGNALVAPVLAYVPEGGMDPPTSHMRFAGTLTIPQATFESVLEYTARSLRASGFRDIVFIGDHGGYRRSVQAVAARLGREWKNTPVRVHALTEYYRAFEKDYASALKARGHSEAAIGTHAGLADTSVALAVDPALVRTGELKAGRDLDAAHGVYGDPRGASAELGRIGVDLIVQRSVDAIRQAVRR